MSGPNLSPRSSMAKLAPSVAAAAASASTSASASGPKPPPRTKKTGVKKAVRTDSTLKRKTAVRGRFQSRSQSQSQSRSQTRKKALPSPPRRRLRDVSAIFERGSQTRKPLSRTTSKGVVTKSREGRRLSLPNLFSENKSSKGAPKGYLDTTELEKLIPRVSVKQRKVLFDFITKNKLEKARKFKLPPKYLVDSEAVAKLEKDQVKARQAMHETVAAGEHKELQKKLKEKKEKLDKFEKELNEYKKAHQAKGSKVLGIPTEIISYIKRLNELATPNMLEKGASKMTQLEIEYKRQYDKLNEHVQKLSKDYEESRKTVAVGDTVLNAERAKLSTTQSQAQRELVEMAQVSRAKATAVLKASEAAKALRLTKEAAAKDFQTIMGPGQRTTFGKKRRSKKGSKKKTRGASKKKVGGYSSNSNKPNNYGSYP